MSISRAVLRPRGILALVGLLSVLAVGGAVLVGAPAAAKGSPAASQRTSSHALRHDAGGLSITSMPWGTADGQSVNLYTLTNGSMTVKITNYGGVVQSIWVPDKAGNLTDVALGFPSLSDYVSDFTQGALGTPWPLAGGSGDTYFGAIIGRYANRIANASFDLNGTSYKLDANNGTNTLHGGYLGWNTQVWNASTQTGTTGVSLTLTDSFPAGEGCLPALSPGCAGFPAPVTATVVYTLTNDSQLKINYKVTNTSPNLATVVNVTNHTYFNLAGEGNNTVYHQLLALNGDLYTPVNTNLIPEAPYFVSVAGTPYDFRVMHPIGEYIRDTNLPDGTTGALKQLQIAHGYDNNWVLNGGGTYRLVALAQDPRNGVTLWAYTDQPGVQLYSGNFLVGDLIGTSGRVYRQGDGFTLETQHYPDAPHHIGQSGWVSVVLGAGHTFTTTTSFKFGVVARDLAGQFIFR